MSPRYKEVDVPEAVAPEFEEFLAQRGGSFKGKGLTPQEHQLKARPEWIRQSEHARGLVAQMKGEHDSQTTLRITAGVARLIIDTYSISRTALNEEIDWGEVRNTLTALFEDSLPVEPPYDIYTLETATGAKLSRRGGRDKLLPRTIALTIERYGLADEKPKTFLELSQTYGGVSPPMVGQLLRQAYQHIGRDPEIRQLCLKGRLR